MKLEKFLFCIILTLSLSALDLSLQNLSAINVSASTRIENNKYGYVRSADATISKTELKPGEAVEINLAITSTFPSRWEDQDVIATVSYELQGETRYFYFIIKYRGWDNE